MTTQTGGIAIGPSLRNSAHSLAAKAIRALRGGAP